MNEAYKKAIAILSEVKVEQADPSPGSTAHKRIVTKNNQLRRRSGKQQTTNRELRERLSVHETYGRLINIILEYKKKSKEYWERVRMGSELLGDKPLTGQQRRKISLTKTRADRKKLLKERKRLKQGQKQERRERLQEGQIRTTDGALPTLASRIITSKRNL